MKKITNTFTSGNTLFFKDKNNTIFKNYILKLVPLVLFFCTTFNVVAQGPANALDFDGTNDFAAIAHNSNLNVTEYTIETWVKWGRTGTAVDFICSKGNESMEIHTGGDSNNNIRFVPASGVFLDGGINAIAPGTWVHIACVYKPSIGLAKMYLNGVDVPLTNNGTNPITTTVANSTNNFLIGARLSINPFHFKGQLDEFRIWNVALTQAQIQSRMNCEIATNATNLVVNLHFNQGVSSDTNTSITDAVDATSNLNNATLNNFALSGTASNFVASGAAVTPVTPTFTAVGAVCFGATLALLPTTSNNSITGTWSPALNNSVTTTYTFTPTAGLCANSTTLTITVNPKATPTFTQVAAICAGDTLLDLPTSSTNTISVTGTWSPALNNSVTTTYTFTPTVGLCANTTTMTITVNPKTTPTFTQVAAICAGDTLLDLPTNSTNATAVTGTWSPALNNSVTTTYTFTPTAGLCANTTTMTITVNPKTTPTFTQVPAICFGATLSDLPTSSTNTTAVTGTWSPALNNTATTTYTFTPTAGLCANTTTMTITVNPKVTPTFTQVAAICAGATLSALPTSSTNITAVTGTWSPALNNQATTTYTFTPTAGLCANTTTMTISVTPKVTPTFTQVAAICAGETLLDLPTSSTNTTAVTGTWAPALNNQTTTTYTFTPTAGFCANSTTMTITVNPKATPTFTQVAAICAGSTLSNLPTSSTNATAVTGTWSPALNNQATTTYTFTPTAGLCANSTTMSITVNPILVPRFSFASAVAVCPGDTAPTRPNTSSNGITGNWQLTDSNAWMETYVFNPTAGQCASTFTVVNTFLQQIIPTFDQVAPICEGAALSALPTTSTEGIIGTWTPALDNVSTTTYTFLQTGLCGFTTTMTIVVNSVVTPLFTQVDPICSGLAVSPLPTTSDDGITGTWSPALDNTATTTYTFTPTAGLCADTTTMTIDVNPSIINSTTVTNCGDYVWPYNSQTYTASGNYDVVNANCNIERLILTITPVVTPSFTQVQPINSGETLSALPMTSNNNIAGTWSPAINNTSTTTYTFTPTTGLCASAATMAIVVNQPAGGVALDFDGTNDFVSIPHNTNLDLEKLTIETWIKATNTEDLQFICSKEVTAMEIHLKGDGGIRFIPTSGLFLDAPELTIPNDTWFHLACTYDPTTSTAKMYVNAQEITLSTTGGNPLGTPIAFNTAPFTIGARTVNRDLPFVGQIDEFRLWNKALTQAEVTNAMNCGVAGAATDLRLNLHLNQGIANAANAGLTTATDASGSNNNGTLNNFALAGASSNWAAPGGFTSTAIVPTFTAVAAVCPGTTLTALPTTSNNGFAGTWSPALNNQATTTYTFTPTATAQCVSTAALTIAINGTAPTFTQVAPICSGAALAALPTSSTNTTPITGTWAPALNNTTTTTYTFTPTAGQCAATATMTITVNSTGGNVQQGSVCNSQTWYGTTYTASGTYTHTYSNASGCVITDTLNLTILPNVSITATAGSNGSISDSGTTTVCGGKRYNFTPNSGFGVATVTVDGVLVANNNFYDFDDVTANHTITVTFSCIVVIPDANFKAALVANTAINTNGDGQIQCTEAIAFTGIINVNPSNITNLTGIAAFVNMTDFRCVGNPLTSLDLSSNTALTKIICNDSSLTNLNLSSNTALTYLDCTNNSLTSLNLSNNTALTRLECSSNNLSSLNLGNNTALTFLVCGANAFTSLDVSANTALTAFSCNSSSNSIPLGIGVLTSLNLKNGNNTILANMNALGNPSLNCILVDNATNAAGYSGWIKDSWGFYSSTPCATPCFVTIPNANFKAKLLANTAINTNGDGQIQCSEAIAFTGLMNVSSSNIADLTGIASFVNITGLNCNDNQLTALNVNSNTALTNLNCNFNRLTSLNVTNNTALSVLNCRNNKLTNLNVSSNTALTLLYCNENKITNLNVSSNIALNFLDCKANEISTLNVSSNTALINLRCGSNYLTTLDISSNTALTLMDCGSSGSGFLTNLNLKNGQNAILVSMDATGNPNLACIEVDNVANANNYIFNGWFKDSTASFNTTCATVCLVAIPDANFKAKLLANTAINTNGDAHIQCSEAIAFTGAINVAASAITNLTGIASFVNLAGLDCSTNALTGLNVSSNTALTNLKFSSITSLTSLDLSSNSALTTLFSGDNANLTNINLNNNVALISLTIKDNANLTSLDLSNNTALTYLDCNNNNLTSLNVNNNTALTYLNCNGNFNLSSLNVSNNVALTLLSCSNTKLTSLNVSNNTALITLSCGATKITALDISNNTALTVLNCSSISANGGIGLLTTLNLKNGNNAILTTMNALGNPSLNCILVDNATNAAGYSGWQKDSWGFYSSTPCATPCFVNIPDANFKAKLLANTAINTNGDGQIQCSEATAFTGTMDVVNSNIADLTGIASFVNLTGLNCRINNLTVLNLSSNIALTTLNCSSNFIISMNLSSNTALTILNCNTNPNLTSLNLNNNTALTTLFCSNTALTGLNISNNTALTYLNCSANFNLSSLNVSSNTALTYLNCANTNITSLNVSSNTALTYLNCSFTNITSLNVTNNTALTELNCGLTKITALDVTSNTALTVLNCTSLLNNGTSSGLLTTLNLKNGQNAILTAMYAKGNPNLTCIQVDNVANANGYSTNNIWRKDAAASYDINCATQCLVTIPDANFKAKLLANTAINTNGDGQIQCSEAIAFTGTMNVASSNIADLTGIASFVNITGLNCGSNNLSALNVSSNIALTTLSCNQDNLTTLNLSSNTALQYLDCNNNNLTTINLSSNTALTFLNCTYNLNLTSLNISSNTALTYLDCSTNFSLTSLDVSANTALTYLDCRSNSNLSSLNVSSNTALTYLNCSNTNITSLNVSNNTALTTLECRFTKITALDISNNSALTSLNCSSVSLTGSSVGLLTTLNLKNGQNALLTSMNAKGNPNLTCIQVDNVANANGYSTNNIWRKDAAASYDTNCATQCLVTIPDANFKAKLLANTAINTNGDGQIQCSEAVAFTGTINVASSNIADLTGIASFVNIMGLNCKGNNLTALNVSSNMAITNLNCGSNINLTSLNFSSNTALVNLYCNQITNLNSINLNSNTALSILDCSENRNLTSLNISNNTALAYLDCSTNNLASLNVSNNTALTFLNCGGNSNLSSLNVSSNIALTILKCTETNLTSLNVSSNTALTTLECRFTKITSLDVSNNILLTSLHCSSISNSGSSLGLLTSLNLKNGQNALLTSMNVKGNPSLNCILVDNATNAAGYSGWQKDSWGFYSSTPCATPCFVNIPDANFKAKLLANTAINTNGDGQIQCSEAIAFTGTMNVASSNIADLTGIASFVNIMGLDCRNNNLTTLNVSSNTALTNLNCDRNNLTALNVSGTIALRYLYCTTNRLTTLALNTNVALEDLSCNDNNLTSLDVSNNTALKGLDCSENAISSLLVNTNIALRNLDCGYNNLSSLNVSTNTLLTNLSCNNNLINSLNVTTNTALGVLYCDNNNLTTLDVSNNILLYTLICQQNQLTNLNLGTTISPLYQLICYDNRLTSLNASAKNVLFQLLCNNNNLSSLDLGANPALRRLDCTYNNNLQYLDISNGTNANFFYMRANNNPSLTCIQVDNVGNANGYSTWQKDAAASYNTFCAPCVVNIPDANFKTALLANTAINTNSDSEIQCDEAITFTGAINVVGLGITNLTGIAAFVNITGLNCSDNNLSSLNVDSNIALTSLNCSFNSITTINVSNNVNLTILILTDNFLTALNVNSNTALTKLECDYNSIVTLNTSTNTALTILNCAANDLTMLNVSSNLALTYLNCARNSISVLNINNNTALTFLDCSVNNLSALNVSNNLALSTLNCSRNRINSLNVATNTALTRLECGINSFTALNLSSNTALTYLNCRGVAESSVPTVLNSLNLKNGNNATLISMFANNNPNLLCIEVDNVTNSNGYSGWFKDAAANYTISVTNAVTSVTACANYTWSNTGQSYSTSGIYTGTTSNCVTQKLNLTINSTPSAPTAASNQSFCSGETLANIAVTGTGIVWYNVATAGTILPSTTSIQSGTTYYASQTANGCESSNRKAITLTDGACLGNENFDASAFSYYPNPTTGKVYFSYAQAIEKISVSNVLGQVILENLNNSNQAEIDLAGFAGGTYFVKLTSDNQIKTIKILKN